MTDGDGSYFKAYSQTRTDLDNILSDAISKLNAEILNTPWFKDLSTLLKWDGKHRMCLVRK